MKTLLLLIAIAASVFAQKGKDDNKPDRWPVELHINLAVTDAAQKPVADLKISDIKVFENDVEQKVTYFADKPVSNVVFVMDNTGSMRTQLDLVFRIGTVIAENLLDTNSAMVVRFVGNDKITVQQPWTTDKAKLKAAFNNMFIEGGQSAVYDGIYLAAQQLIDEAKKQPNNRFAIILVSDGADRNSYYSQKQLFSMVSGTDVQIYAIGLTRDLIDQRAPFNSSLNSSERDRAEKFLRTLAARTGGTAFILGKKYTTDDVKDAVISLITELRSPYVIGYTSTDQKHNGSSRKLRVEIADTRTGQKRTAAVRNTFIVPKD